MTRQTDTVPRSPRRQNGDLLPVVRRTSSRALPVADRNLFLDTLAATCNVLAAAARAGRSSQAFYGLRRRDPLFAEQWIAALQIGYETLEARLIDYAMGRALDPNCGATVDGASDGDGSGGGGEDGATAKVKTMPIPGTGLVSGSNPGIVGVPPEIQVGLSLLARHRATLDGRKPTGRARRVVTAAETDAVLNKRLDQLARSLGQVRP